MDLRYSTTDTISAELFRDLLKRSTLAERRPVHDLECLQGMLDHADILITCWEGEMLVGVARSVTDFFYCCYLSDLAVDQNCQRAGIGTELIRRTQEKLGRLCKIILLSAPAAVDYYPRIGFTSHPSAWIMSHGELKAP